MKMTRFDLDPIWPFSLLQLFNHQKQSKVTFAIRCKKRKYLYHYISVTYSIFSIFYGKKLAFCFGFLYLCTGNRKNSLLVPKVGHLWRPRLVLIDGKRWSSMKTTKMGRERLSGELWFKKLLNADWAWQTSRTFKTSRKTPALQTSGESYSSPSTLQLSNPISLALSGPKVK